MLTVFCVMLATIVGAQSTTRPSNPAASSAQPAATRDVSVASGQTPPASPLAGSQPTAAAAQRPAISDQRPIQAQAASGERPAASVVSPDAFFGFRLGTDGKLAVYADIQRYFEQVAAASDRVRIVSLGPTTEGQDLIAAVISAPENMARLEEIRANNQRLADPRTLAEPDARAIAEREPAVIAIGASIHASEIGATQAASELLYELATSNAPETLALLRSLVIVLLPSLNPDGNRTVVDWFERNRGTEFESAPMPWLDHKYAGHDINRDAFMLNLVENRRYAQFFYRVWHPQVFLTMHQMGARGPRLFVPPNYDPIDPNYDPLIWRTAGLLGHAMAMRAEREGKAGVVQNAMYDYYWPGYEDSAPLGHNTVCMLSEVASVRLALPIDIKPEDLVGSPRGLPEYRAQTTFPNPWPGGTWHLRDIVDYDLTAARGLLDGAARYRRELLEDFYAMGRSAVEIGRTRSPFAFAIPPEQYDPYAAAALANLLIDGAVEVHEAVEPFKANDRDYPAGTRLVLMAQPYRAYAKTLLEPQSYPVRRLLPNAPPERPYDVAGWTLPYQMGVRVDTIARAFETPVMARLEHAALTPSPITGDPRPTYFVADARGNGGAIAINRLLATGIPVAWTLDALDVRGGHYAPGTLVLPATRTARAKLESVAHELGTPVVGVRGPRPLRVASVRSQRIGLYKPWVANVDEGWTRWLLEHYEFPFVSLSDADIRGGGLRGRVDVLILPDAAPDRLTTGHLPGSEPPPYVGGLGSEGVAAIDAFVRSGGTLVCLDSSCGVPMDALALPVKDLLRDLPPEKFFCPGSILRLKVDPKQPLAFGMPEQTAAFFATSSAYEILPPGTSPAPSRDQTAKASSAAPSPSAGITANAVAWYGDGDPLLSGWLEGPGQIAGKAAVLDVRVGRGRIVLLGFRAQHRAQSHATFRLLFNAIYSAQ